MISYVMYSERRIGGGELELLPSFLPLPLGGLAGRSRGPRSPWTPRASPSPPTHGRGPSITEAPQPPQAPVIARLRLAMPFFASNCAAQPLGGPPCLSSRSGGHEGATLLISGRGATHLASTLWQACHFGRRRGTSGGEARASRKFTTEKNTRMEAPRNFIARNKITRPCRQQLPISRGYLARRGGGPRGRAASYAACTWRERAASGPRGAGAAHGRGRAEKRTGEAPGGKGGAMARGAPWPPRPGAGLYGQGGRRRPISSRLCRIQNSGPRRENFCHNGERHFGLIPEGR